MTRDNRKRWQSHGITHSLNVYPNENNTGWLISAASMGGSALVNLPQAEAETLAAMLLAGPGEVKYVCEVHQKLTGVCLQCLT